MTLQRIHVGRPAEDTEPTRRMPQAGVFSPPTGRPAAPPSLAAGHGGSCFAMPVIIRSIAKPSSALGNSLGQRPRAGGFGPDDSWPGSESSMMLGLGYASPDLKRAIYQLEA